MLTREEEYDEALSLIQKARLDAPPSFRGEFIETELYARIGQSFEKRDFAMMVEMSQHLVEREPDDPGALAALASAYACKYAASGETKDRDDALRYLAQARTNLGPDADMFKGYENRLQHRLKTRKLMTRKQFEQQYPHGWNAEGEK